MENVDRVPTAPLTYDVSSNTLATPSHVIPLRPALPLPNEQISTAIYRPTRCPQLVTQAYTNRSIPFKYTFEPTPAYNANARIRCLPCQKAKGPANLRRRRLQRHKKAKGSSRCDHQGTVGQVHDGAIGERGVKQVLLPGGKQSLGQMREAKR